MLGFLIVATATLTTGALGLVGAGLLASACVRWYSISSVEGGSGYFVVGIALVGAVVGGLVGLVAAMTGLFGTERFAGWSAIALGWASAGSILALATPLAYLLAPVHRAEGGRHASLEIEFRVPSSLCGDPESPPASIRGASLVLCAIPLLGDGVQTRGGSVDPARARREADCWIVPATMSVWIDDETIARVQESGSAGDDPSTAARVLRLDPSWSAWRSAPEGFLLRERPHKPSRAIGREP